MKRTGYLMLLVVAVSGAIAAPASATVLTSSGSSEGTAYTGPISAAGEVTFHGLATLTCTESVFEAEISQHGPTVTAGGKITNLSFKGCSNIGIKVLKLGEIIIHTGEAGNGDGTVTLNGTEFEATGANKCLFKLEETDIGTLTGGGGFDLQTVGTHFGFGCGTMTMTAGYTFTQPTALYVD